MIDDPIAFLRAALDRAEETAKAAVSPGPWRVNQYDYDAEGFDAGIEWREPRDVAGHGYEGGGIVYLADAHHIAAWSPTVVLAQVAADRKLIEACDTVLTGWYYGEAKELAHDVLLLRAKAWGWKDEQHG